MVTFKRKETYLEIELFDGDTKIGEAEVDINGKMLCRLSIFEPYQNQGRGTAVVKALTEEYGLNVLWVRADNHRAIHVYEKCGYVIDSPAMLIMKKQPDSPKEDC